MGGCVTEHKVLSNMDLICLVTSKLRFAKCRNLHAAMSQCRNLHAAMSQCRNLHAAMSQCRNLHAAMSQCRNLQEPVLVFSLDINTMLWLNGMNELTPDTFNLIDTDCILPDSLTLVSSINLYCKTTNYFGCCLSNRTTGPTESSGTGPRKTDYRLC